jgi:hypothetical protein
MSKKDFKLNFNTTLSFAQELRETPLGSGRFLPASNTIPDCNLIGKCEINFDENFKYANLKLKITGDMSGDKKITLSHLHLQDASATGPLTVSLYPNKKAITKIKNDKFTLKITLENSDIIPRNNKNNYSTNTIISLYNAIRGNNLYVDVHGKNEYILGMLRGQFYTPF